MEDSEKAYKKMAKDQIQFLDLLKNLTQRGKCKWFQSDSEPGYVYCLAGDDELIIFECLGGEKGDEPVPPSEPLAGVASEFRNSTYLWLEGLGELCGWDLLMKLLRSAQTNHDKVLECRRIAHSSQIRVLEELLKDNQ